MSDEGPSNVTSTDDELTLPKATVQKLINGKSGGCFYNSGLGGDECSAA
jgi:hypothetical protein